MSCRKTSLEKKVGESLIRTLLSQPDKRVRDLEKEFDSGNTGEYVFRYRVRLASREYKRLEKLAAHYGFTV